MISRTCTNPESFEQQWPERAAEAAARRAAMPPKPKPAFDEAAMMAEIHKRQTHLSRGITLLKAVEQLVRGNPVETVAWLERSFHTAPGYEPKT